MTMNYLSFLTVLDEWATATADIEAAAILGFPVSQPLAIGPAVDISLLIVAPRPNIWLTDTDWSNKLDTDYTEYFDHIWFPGVTLIYPEFKARLHFISPASAYMPISAQLAQLVGNGMTPVADSLLHLDNISHAVSANKILDIRHHQVSDAAAIAELVHLAVHQIPDRYYSLEQKSAWAPSADNIDYWLERLVSKKPFVAEFEGQVTGFAELDPDGTIDNLYVHPDYQRMGIASQLIKTVESEARQFGLKRLSTRASEVGRYFFLNNQFELISIEETEIRGVKLHRYLMTRQLTV